MAVSQKAQNVVIIIGMLIRNMLIHLQVPLGFGCLVTPSQATRRGLLLGKSKIIFSGFSGSVLVTVYYCCYHGYLVFMQFTFASNTATIIGGTLVGQQIQLRIISVFVYAFFMSVSNKLLNL